MDKESISLLDRFCIVLSQEIAFAIKCKEEYSALQAELEQSSNELRKLLENSGMKKITCKKGFGTSNNRVMWFFLDGDFLEESFFVGEDHDYFCVWQKLNKMENIKCFKDWFMLSWEL